MSDPDVLPITSVVVTTDPTGLAVDAGLLAGQLTASSIAMYRRDWAAYAAWCAGADQSPFIATSLARWRTHLAEGTTLAPATINRMLSACKRLVTEGSRQGFLPAELAAAFAEVQGVKARALKGRQRSGTRTRIEPAEMRRLCDAPDATTLRGQRDRAMLATLASSGVRIAELVGLQVQDLHSRKGGYLVTVLGKTDTVPREAPLTGEAYHLIQVWLQARPVISTYLFTAFGGRGTKRVLATPITTTGAWQTVQGYADACGLTHITPHSFRRFLGTQLAAKDIRKAQRALGHKSIETTARHYVLDELEMGISEGLY